MDMFEITVSAILSTLGFNVFLKALNISVLKLFVPIQKRTSKLKKKNLYRSLVIILFVVLLYYLVESFSLNNIMFGLILGFLISLESILFEQYVEL